jgi:hypothetical protein
MKHKNRFKRLRNLEDKLSRKKERKRNEYLLYLGLISLVGAVSWL